MVTRSRNLKGQNYSSTSNKPSTQTRRTGAKGKSARPRREITEVDDAPIGNNTRGLSGLPDELLLEIMSSYPVSRPDSLLTDYQDYRVLAEEANKQIKRRDTLTALSQTCGNLRRFVRPYIWSRIEVCPGMHVAGTVLCDPSQNQLTAAENRIFNAELVRQLEIVTVRDPSLAQYIKLVHIEVVDCSTPRVLEELARCISLFPNLRLVKLRIEPPSRKADKLAALEGKAFSQYSYPQIDQVVVSRSAFAFLRSCPSVRSVRVRDFGGWSGKFELRYLKGFCPHMENLALEMSELGSEVETLQAFPKLRSLTVRFDYFYNTPFSEVFTALRTLKHLKNIKLMARFSISKPYTRQLILDLATELLSRLQEEDKEEKEVSLVHPTFAGLKTRRVTLPAP
ncbi:hypothetical protein GALMADRAFT_136419 [Galerina marginata CBS 339.88]|uniref:F-box domain-containing protein n=1 Tax=Galerina marginata (strain CBS 339.88) TaxID=685588 RepID=A0A067TIT4_GALM3|nr:hypothetical protein GALMADRAFT_136419 [Galerina marginata CBS 339.88]